VKTLKITRSIRCLLSSVPSHSLTVFCKCVRVRLCACACACAVVSR
jgi:hypothetical protein